MLWLWLNFTPVLLSNIHTVWEKIPSPSPRPHSLFILSPAAFLQTKLRGRKGGRLYIFAWCIFKPEVSKPRVGRSTVWKKKRKNTFSLLLGLSQEGALMIGHNEERGWTSAGEAVLPEKQAEFRKTRPIYTCPLIWYFMLKWTLNFCPWELCLTQESKWEGGNNFFPSATHFNQIPTSSTKSQWV